MRQRKSETLIDTRPEEYLYRDDGCEVSPSCLNCPLPQCKYDDPHWFLEERRKQRDRQVLEVKDRENLSVPQLAHRFALSQRTVFRILRRASNGEFEPTPTDSTNGFRPPLGLSREPGLLQR